MVAVAVARVRTMLDRMASNADASLFRIELTS